MPRKKYNYVDLNDYEDYDSYNSGDGSLYNTFKPVEFQPGVYEQDIEPEFEFEPIDDPISNNINKQLSRDMTKYQQPSFGWGTVGKYGLGALGVGGAIYGLYRLINYLKNRNQQPTPTVPAAPNPNVVQPPVSPPSAANRFRNRFKNRNKFKRK